MEGGITRLFRSPKLSIQLLVTPNPIEEKATIISRVYEEMPVKITLNDIRGKISSVVFEGLQKEGEQIFPLNLSQYPNGAYVITMITPIGTDSQIVEVQK
jgi:hypothetical protein